MGHKMSKHPRVTLAAAQLPVTHNVHSNYQAIKRAQKAAPQVDYLLTPEAALSGYFNACTYHNHSMDTTVDEYMHSLSAHAHELDSGLVLGTAWRDGSRMPRNSLRAWDKNRNHQGDYHKRLLTNTLWQTGDVQHWLPGQDHTIWEQQGVRYACLICNDLWAQPGAALTGNPYYVQELVAVYDVDVIFVAANCNDSITDSLYAQWIDLHLRTQAREWAVWFVVSNSTLDPMGQPTPSMMLQAGIVAPNGEWYARAKDKAAETVCADIDILPRSRTGNYTFHRDCDPR